ncbi:hypothetical protein ACFQI7_27145 [Paenibacillus allorhizosphaerae]|uniref:Uncharacterized protein n=1 Tax=Paenibacillus allorhizosphaerae TaxID=2849866 RepID=A0ABM8VLW0_9BACL|nr:hypothetical protein [Paenibacillus allorhizosphaerae]CAG7648997.1 hypothetical protein PAECIP111802_04373 [Paenibacillus allorhizosphaerae]
MGYALQKRERRRTLAFGEKADMLKEHEVYCYQVAYYLLQNEDGARLAAERTLLALYPRCDFYTLPEKERKAAVKAEAVRQSLKVKLDK